MSGPYVGEVRAFAFGFEPEGWARCDGQRLQIARWPALFELIGITYGGDGQVSFALPEIPGLATSEKGIAVGYCIALEGAAPTRRERSEEAPEG